MVTASPSAIRITPTLPVRPDVLRVGPWVDPLVESLGYDACSDYVEQFWLSSLGPTATWLVRRLARGLSESPEGYECSARELAGALGLGRNSSSKRLARTLHRAVEFGMIRLDHTGTLLVRRRLPPLPQRLVDHLPAGLQAAHRAWLDGQRPSSAAHRAWLDARRPSPAAGKMAGGPVPSTDSFTSCPPTSAPTAAWPAGGRP